MPLLNRQYSFLIFTIFIIILSGLACKSQKIPGNWVDSEIRIDGKIDDWNEVPVMFFEDEGVAISFCNDSSWLYIQFRTSDTKWIRTIKMSGITLYFDTTGKKNKNFFVRYKGGPSMEDMRGNKNRRMMNMPSQMNPLAGDTTSQFTCYIKDRIIEKPIHPDGLDGPAVAYDTSYGFYCYEFRLPLKESTIRYYGLGIEPGNPISIGAMWGDMEDLKKMRADIGGIGGLGGGMGVGPGGGISGGRGSGKRGKMPNMPSKQELWIKSHIVAPISEAENH